MTQADKAAQAGEATQRPTAVDTQTAPESRRAPQSDPADRTEAPTVPPTAAEVPATPETLHDSAEPGEPPASSSDTTDAPVVTYRQALNDTLRQEMTRDPDVFLIGEEIGLFEGSYKITAGLLKEFGPERVRDTPIAEEGFTGAAIGAAMLGLRPVVEIMTINFSLKAIDQIVNHAAKIHSMFGGQSSVPVVIRTPGGGGQQLAATHSQNLEVWYAHIPGLKVVAPSTPADAKALLLAAIRDDDPVIFLENLALYNTKGPVPHGDEAAEIGKAKVVKSGTDLTIISYSRGTITALEVAKKLEADGVSVEVVDLRSLRPLDRATICESVRKTSRAVVFEDDWLTYGIGAEISATISEGAFDYLDAPVRRVAAAEVPLPYAKPLERSAMPDAATLTRVVHEVLDATRFGR